MESRVKTGPDVIVSQRNTYCDKRGCGNTPHVMAVLPGLPVLSVHHCASLCARCGESRRLTWHLTLLVDLKTGEPNGGYGPMAFKDGRGPA